MASWRQCDSRAALAAETAPYDGIVRAEPSEVIAKTFDPRSSSPARHRSWTQKTSELAMTSRVISICLRLMASLGSSARNGRSEPKASECMTTRRCGRLPLAREASNRSSTRPIAAARLWSSAAFMLTKMASEPAALMACLISVTWWSPARKSRWMPMIR